MKVYVVTTFNDEIGSDRQTHLTGVFESEAKAIDSLILNGWQFCEEGEVYDNLDGFPSIEGWWRFYDDKDNDVSEIREVELNNYKDPNGNFDWL